MVVASDFRQPCIFQNRAAEQCSASHRTAGCSGALAVVVFDFRQPLREPKEPTGCLHRLADRLADCASGPVTRPIPQSRYRRNIHTCIGRRIVVMDLWKQAAEAAMPGGGFLKLTNECIRAQKNDGDRRRTGRRLGCLDEIDKGTTATCQDQRTIDSMDL